MSLTLLIPQTLSKPPTNQGEMHPSIKFHLLPAAGYVQHVHGM